MDDEHVRPERSGDRRSSGRTVKGLLGALCVAVALVAVAVSVGPATATVAGTEPTESTTAQSTTQSNFLVTIHSTNSPVVAGETLTVTANITNIGENDTQNVTLSVAGAQRDATTVTLSNGESENVTLSWATTEDDVGNYTAKVTTEDNNASTDVAVLQPAFFAVNITNTTSPVTAGQPLKVNATVENTGNSSDEQAVVFSVTGDVQDTTDVALGPGNSTNVTLSWATTSDDAGEYSISVLSDDDVAFGDATVGPPPDFDVVVTDTTSPVTEGETLDVIATVVNTGNVSVTQTVTLTAAGAQRDATDVTLDAGNSTTVVLSWATTSGDAGEYSAEVASETDTGATVVTVNAPPQAGITYEPSSPSTGQEVTFESTASDQDGTIESYEWRIDGEVVSTSRTVSYTFEFAGEHEVALAVTDDNGARGSAEATVTVTGDNLQPSVSLSYAPVAPATGESVTFTAEASDPDGSVASYEWSVDGSTVGSGPELRHTFEAAGEHEVTLTVVDGAGATTTVSTTVSVQRATTPTATPTETTTLPIPGFTVGGGVTGILVALVVRRLLK